MFSLRKFERVKKLPSLNSRESGMEELLLRFSHLGASIFELLDNKSLVTCKKVSKNWNHFIKDQKFPWIRKLVNHIYQKTREYVDFMQRTRNWIKIQKDLHEEDLLRKWTKIFYKIKYDDIKGKYQQLPDTCPNNRGTHNSNFQQGL